MEYENFYEAFRYHLEKKGYGGQSLVCRHTDIPRSYLSRIVNRERRAGTKTQKKIARFFGFGLEEFVEMGRRIVLGENPESAGDLLEKLPEELLVQRLAEAVRKEVQTAQLLDQTQLLYADIVENSRQMIVRFDDKLNITFANNACAQITDTARQSLLGQSWLDFVAEDFRSDLAERVRELTGVGGSFSLELTSSANSRWLYLTITVFPGGAGGKDRGQLVGFDMTEEVLTRQKLAQSERDLNLIYNGSPDIMATIEAGTGIVRKCNRTMCDKLGYTFEHIVGRHFFDFCRESNLGWDRELEIVFERGSHIVDLELHLVKNDGEFLPVLLNVTPIRDCAGKVVSANCVFRDQTERRKLIDRLRFIQHGVEMSHVPTLWVGEDASIVYVNKAVCRLLGYTREELQSLHVWDINPLIPESTWAEKWSWFQAEENVEFSGQYRKMSGEVIPVEFRVSNLEYPDGRRYNVVFVKTVSKDMENCG